MLMLVNGLQAHGCCVLVRLSVCVPACVLLELVLIVLWT